MSWQRKCYFSMFFFKKYAHLNVVEYINSKKSEHHWMATSSLFLQVSVENTFSGIFFCWNSRLNSCFDKGLWTTVSEFIKPLKFKHWWYQIKINSLLALLPWFLKHRSSRPQMFYKIGVFKILQNSQDKQLQSTLLKRGSSTGVFLSAFWKPLRTLFYRTPFRD